MTRRPFDPGELDEPAEGATHSISELERYVASTATDAPRDLGDRVMAAIEDEPAPRRGLFGWLLAPAATDGGMRRFTRVGALAATLLLAVAGALFAGQLAGLVRDIGGDATPTPSPAPSVTDSQSPTMSPSVEASPSGTPEPSADDGSPAPPTGSPQATADETPEPENTPDESDTPRPSATASPNPTATPTS